MNTLMKYKGYIGSIEPSPEDNCLYGRLLYIKPLINYEAQTVKDIQNAFHEAVNDYLVDCSAQGVTPEKPCKGSFNVRIGHEHHVAATLAAAERGITLNDLTRKALSDYLNHCA